MAKRGETRPWRVRFEWANGVEGVDTYRTEEAAERVAQHIRERDANSLAVSVLVFCVVEHRDRPVDVAAIRARALGGEG